MNSYCTESGLEACCRNCFRYIHTNGNVSVNVQKKSKVFIVNLLIQAHFAKSNEFAKCNLFCKIFSFIGKQSDLPGSLQVPTFEFPTRGIARSTAHQNQLNAHQEWKKGSSREGNMPIPIGNVVTVFVEKVDRGHTDPRRFFY